MAVGAASTQLGRGRRDNGDNGTQDGLEWLNDILLGDVHVVNCLTACQCKVLVCPSGRSTRERRNAGHSILIGLNFVGGVEKAEDDSAGAASICILPQTFRQIHSSTIPTEHRGYWFFQ